MKTRSVAGILSAVVLFALTAACNAVGGVAPATLTPTAAPGAPTAVPTAVPTATADPNASPTPNSVLGPTTTYRDKLVGFALDYPVDWHIVPVSDEIKAQSLSYSVSIASFPLEGPGTEGIPAGGAKLDITVIKSAGADLEAAMAEWNKQNEAAEPKQTILRQADVTLGSGVKVKRLQVEGLLGRSELVIAAIKGHMLVISGL